MGTRAKNFRRRADDNDDDNDPPSFNSTKPSSKSTTTTTTPTTKTSFKSATTTTLTAAKSKKPINQAPKLLSFADDEENDETPSRVSSKSSRNAKPSSSSALSHKITSSKDRIVPSFGSRFNSNVQPQAGTYTKEALLELQKNTKNLACSSKPSGSKPVIIMKGLIKPVDTVSNVSREVDDDEEQMESMVMRNRDEAQLLIASMGISKVKDNYPDQATINAARAKREKLRQTGLAAPDYIALDGGSNHGAAEGLSDEEPEFRGRIAIFGNKESGKKGVFEDVNERGFDSRLRQDVEDVEDEEEKIWEEEQFRKALGRKMDNGSSMVVTSSSATVVHSVQQQKYGYPTAAIYAPVQNMPPPPSIGGAIGASQGFGEISIAQQAEIARKSMQENVRRLKESHGITMSSLNRTEENLTASLLNITDLEKSLSDAGEKFIFMQKLRHFVSVICDFLQHKAPFIEELEEQMQKVHEEHASAIIEIRVADNHDEMMEIEAAANAATSVLSKGGSSAAIVEAATSAAHAAAIAVKEQNLQVTLDEHGRDTNLQKRMDMERRAKARKRRKTRSDSKRMSSMETEGSYQRIEGESSTDESDSETNGYQSNREMLLQTADQIFSDAAEDFSQLSVVKERFDTWKKYYSSSYRDAYMSLSIPAIFSPYVRLELLKWDPLHVRQDFNNMNWHSLLFDYGLTEDGFNREDADGNLVPELVEKIALPILHREIAHCWDMLSNKETENAVSATRLVASYAVSELAFGELLAAIHSRLSDAVTTISVPVWSPLVMKAVPNAGRIAAYRFGTSIRLMRNICLWKDILSDAVLEKLALDELLCGKILPHVRSIKSNIHDAITRTERIIASLSGMWTGTSVEAHRSYKLPSLVELVQMLGKSLEKKQSLGITESEITGLARRLKKMLVDLNEYDKARAILRTFHLKEAL